MELSFTVPTLPVAQPRQRSGVVAGHAANYTPRKHPVNTFKFMVKMAAQAVYKGPPMEGPIRLRLVFFFPRPSRLRWKKKPMVHEFHTSAPDFDNLAKAFVDSLNQVIWVDDGQLCSVEIIKVYADGREQPHVEATIKTLGNESVGRADKEGLFATEECVEGR